MEVPTPGTCSKIAHSTADSPQCKRPGTVKALPGGHCVMAKGALRHLMFTSAIGTQAVKAVADINFVFEL
jgi:hypothetical protein